MKRGLVVLVILMILVVILIGCDALKKKDEGPETGTTFIGGTQGVDMIFVDGQPPERVLDNSEETFSIVLLVENLGEYTIPKGRMIASLEGISQEAFGLKSLSINSGDDLEKRRKTREDILEAGPLDMNFGDASYKPDLPGDLNFNLKASLCYDYKSDAVTSICLKKNVLRRDPEAVCFVDPDKGLSVDNSGAPVQIVNLVERPSGSNKVSVFFDIENQGVGEVYEPGTFSSVCEKLRDKEGGVSVSVETTSKALDVKCSTLGDSNKGNIKLIDGKKTVRCTIDTSNLQETAFIEPLIIRAEYMYRDAIITPLTVENAEF